MKKPRWLIRLRLGKGLKKIEKKLKLHRCMIHHAACLIEISKVVLPDHHGYKGARDLLRDGKAMMNKLENCKSEINELLNPGPQPAE